MLRHLTLLVSLLLAIQPIVNGQAGAAASQDGPELVTLNVQNVPLGAVLESLSVRNKVNIVSGVDTQVPVSANFYDATLDQALDWILTPLGFAWSFDGDVYTVMPQAAYDAIAQPLVHHIFRPNYMSVVELERFLTQFLSPLGRIVLSEAPAAGIPSGGDEAGGLASTMPETLIAIDTQESIDRMLDLALQLDRRPRQVLVEATIIEVVLDETNRFGVDFTLLGGSGLAEFESLLATGSAYSASTLAVPGQPLGVPPVGSSTSGAPFLQPENTLSIGQNGFTDGPGSDGLRLGFVGDKLAAFIEALQSTVDTNVLANTKVLALNKMRGELIIGGRLGYFGGTTVSDGISQQTVEFLEVGTQLRFRPYIGNDGFVRLEIHPQRSGGVVDPVTGLPSETTSEVTTNVMVRDGQTVAIGGLIESKDVTTIKRIPILGTLPWIGWLFSSEKSEVKRTEIIVLLTPRILEDGAAPGDGAKDLADANAGREVFRANYGYLARVEHARRVAAEARAELDEGDLDAARRLCDRALLLDPLGDGILELSSEIDARAAEWQAGEVEVALLTADR
ncbi:MAG: hypothetical protein ACT4PU_05005 [Planctomycetota bacterium]